MKRISYSFTKECKKVTTKSKKSNNESSKNVIQKDVTQHGQLMLFLKVSIFLLKAPGFKILLVTRNPASEFLLETSKSQY